MDDKPEEYLCYECGNTLPTDSTSHGLCNSPLCYETWLQTNKLINEALLMPRNPAAPTR